MTTSNLLGEKNQTHLYKIMRVIRQVTCNYTLEYHQHSEMFKKQQDQLNLQLLEKASWRKGPFNLISKDG